MRSVHINLLFSAQIHKPYPIHTTYLFDFNSYKIGATFVPTTIIRILDILLQEFSFVFHFQLEIKWNCLLLWCHNQIKIKLKYNKLFYLLKIKHFFYESTGCCCWCCYWKCCTGSDGPKDPIVVTPALSQLLLFPLLGSWSTNKCSEIKLKSCIFPFFSVLCSLEENKKYFVKVQVFRSNKCWDFIITRGDEIENLSYRMDN